MIYKFYYSHSVSSLFPFFLLSFDEQEFFILVGHVVSTQLSQSSSRAHWCGLGTVGDAPEMGTQPGLPSGSWESTRTTCGAE